MGSTLREALESAVSEVEARESTVAETPETPVVETAPVESVQPDAAPIGETDAQRTERLRDEKGRFTEGKAAPKSEGKLPAQPAPAVVKLPKPDSWKKEYQADWDAMTPRQQEYAKLREDQYFKGVSTYQQEWKGAKPLLDAIAPHVQDMQRYGIEPAQHVGKLLEIHRGLALGTPQEKLNAFTKLAQDCQVPLQALYDPNYAQQYVQQMMQQPQQRHAPQQADVATLVDQKFNEYRTRSQIEDFEAAKDASGNTLYPHFTTVKADMALLLDAGKAQDLKSAYSMALRLHDDLFAASQAEKQKTDEVSRLEAQRKAVAAAKGSAVSVKSATPASAGAAPKKGIRSQLEDAFDTHMAGRV